LHSCEFPETSWKKTLENCALSLLAFSALVMESLITRATTTTNRFPGLAYPQTAFPGGELIQVENAQKFIVQKKFSFKRKKNQTTVEWADFTCHRLLLFALPWGRVRWKSVLKCWETLSSFSMPLSQLCSAAWKQTRGTPGPQLPPFHPIARGLSPFSPFCGFQLGNKIL